MLQPVHVGHKSLADYGTLVSRALMQELRRLAEPCDAVVGVRDAAGNYPLPGYGTFGFAWLTLPSGLMMRCTLGSE